MWHVKLLAPSLAALAVLAALGCGPKQDTARAATDLVPRETEARPGVADDPGARQPGGADTTADSGNSPGVGSVTGATPPAVNPAAPPAGANEPTPPPKVESGSADLKFAFNANDTYQYKSSASVTSEAPGPQGKSEKSTYGTSQTLAVKVLSVKDGVAELQTTTKDFKVTGDTKDPQAQMVQGMMASAGELVSKAVYNSRGVPQGTNADLDDPVRSMVNGVGSSLGVLGINYPSSTIKAGDSWTTTFDMGKLMSARMPPGITATVANGKIPAKYTLVSVDAAQGIAVIKISMSGQPSMTIRLPSRKDAEGKETKMDPMTVNLRVSSSGTAKIDLKTGMPIEITTESTSETTGTQIMDGKQTSKTTIKRA